jgi:DNA-binding NarL/FixJ family response regulator
MSKVLLLIKDLVFSSKIREVASQFAVEVYTARDDGSYREKLETVKPDLVIVDLNLIGADAIAIASAKYGYTPRRMIAFLSHVDTAIEERALAAGISEVVSRGQFVKMLPDLFV